MIDKFFKVLLLTGIIGPLFGQNYLKKIKTNIYYADEDHSMMIKDIGCVRCLSVDADFKYIQSCLNLNDPKNPVNFYVKEMADGVDLVKTDIQNVLVIGLGGGALPTAWQYRDKKFKVETVELSSKMKDVSKKYFLFKETDNNQIIIDDGAAYLSKSEKIYEYIGLDAYNNHLIPDEFTKKEFAKNVYQHLDRNGVFAINYCHPERYKEMQSMLASFFDIIEERSSGDSKVIFYAKKHQI